MAHISGFLCAQSCRQRLFLMQVCGWDLLARVCGWGLGAAPVSLAF